MFPGFLQEGLDVAALAKAVLRETGTAEETEVNGDTEVVGDTAADLGESGVLGDTGDFGKRAEADRGIFFEAPGYGGGPSAVVMPLGLAVLSVLRSPVLAIEADTSTTV